MGNRKINTFSKSMTEEEAKQEMKLGTSVGKTLLKADALYEKRRKK